MSERHVLDEQHGAVLTLTLNRAEKRNALGNQLRGELDECLARAGEDDSISVIVIKANGPDFSAGMDVKANIGINDDLAAAQRGVTGLQDFMLRVRDVPKATIAQVHGHCVGLATQLAICCDIVVAAEDARIGVPGWPNDWIADWWVFRVGAQRAKLMNFTSGSLLSGLEAVEWGFAAKAYPADRLEAETQRLAAWIAKTPVEMLRLKKHAINQAEDQMGFRTVARYTATQNTLISRSESGHTGGDYARAHGFAAARERYGPPPPVE